MTPHDAQMVLISLAAIVWMFFWSLYAIERDWSATLPCVLFVYWPVIGGLLYVLGYLVSTAFNL